MAMKKNPAEAGLHQSASTRRLFMAVAGAAISAPVAAAASWLPPSGGRTDAQDRLARLEDEHAIRTLNQAHCSTTPGITPHGFGEHDQIEIASDRKTATARFSVTLHTETELEPCPLVEMARLQGGGVIARAEHVVLRGVYARGEDGWKILHVETVKA